MLKQVQMTRSAGYRLQGLGSREENRQSVQGFNATEKVVRAAVCGSPSLCHPGLDPGSALLKAWLGVAGWGLEEQEKRLTVERFSVLRKERLQVPRCKL